MCEEIMYEVSGCHLLHESGILREYRRRSVIGENYPAIFPDKDAIVDGLIYRNVPSSAWDRLDRFEGEMYERHHVTIELKDRSILSAETYIIHPAYLNRLAQSDWAFDEFLRSGKTSFQRNYKGYQSL